MKLVIATTNKGKLREIVDILSSDRPPVALQLIALSELPPIVEPEETGLTFAENARLKALYYARATGLPCVADDSGIEIAALDNLPGVHSARWEGTTYARKFRRIYEVLAARGLKTSPARFVCHVALANDDRIEFEAEGVVEGQIAPEPRGTNGFGYDPIFFYPPFGATLAEIDLARKATVSHRGRAFSALAKYLSSSGKM
jgi:XTP/dITP diphosphohydrolase